MRMVKIGSDGDNPCMGPTIVINAPEGVNPTDIEIYAQAMLGEDTPAKDERYNPNGNPIKIEPGTTYKADVGMYKVWAKKLPEGKTIQRWAGHLALTKGHERNERVLSLYHQRPDDITPILRDKTDTGKSWDAGPNPVAGKMQELLDLIPALKAAVEKINQSNNI